MSQNYFIKNLFNIKDKNISFDYFHFDEKIIKGIKTKIFYATLSYDSHKCPHCHEKELLNMDLKLLLLR